ncbi:MAG: AraC family ligand binding domain-containing protein [Flavobacteriaceae bacterium]|nr:AraC family ligand binding domain-containing protein [Flavobacteriaceae bacterium]
MKSSSLLNQIIYKGDKPAISVLFETESTKEIRIAMKKDHQMKEHQTPFPIVVEVFEGTVDFGVESELHHLKRGDILALEGGVPHDLLAKSDCIIRLTLSKSDSVKRVEKVAE